jgi:hypothetical protein
VVLRLQFLLFRSGVIYKLARFSRTLPIACYLKTAQRFEHTCQPSKSTTSIDYTSNAWTNCRSSPHQNKKFISVYVRKVFEVELSTFTRPQFHVLLTNFMFCNQFHVLFNQFNVLYTCKITTATGLQPNCSK